MWRPEEFKDPVRILERTQSGTCKGCPHERAERFFGRDHLTCALGRPHGDKCENYGKRAAMTIFDNSSVTPQDDIDSILLDWYEWSNSEQGVDGYAPSDSTCRDFRSSRQWDASYLDDEVSFAIQTRIGELADPVVTSLPGDYRVAVMTAVRNMAAGHQVFRNPRRPDHQQQDYAEAKLWLRPKLRAKGLL